MRLRLILSIAALLALAAGQPCFAKNGHAQHGARTSSSNSGASGKDVSGANPGRSKASGPIDARETIAPPVPPPHGVRQQRVRIINPSSKNLVNAPRGQAGVRTSTAPTARNAIGQPVVSPKNFTGAQPPVLTLQRPGAGSPLILHGRPAVSPAISSGAVRVNVANGTNRDNLNGATLIRPTTNPSVVGGPAQARYGINGTTVQHKH